MCHTSPLCYRPIWWIALYFLLPLVLLFLSYLQPGLWSTNEVPFPFRNFPCPYCPKTSCTILPLSLHVFLSLPDSLPWVKFIKFREVRRRVTVAGLTFIQISMISTFLASGNKDFFLHTLPEWTYGRCCLLISMHSTYHSNRLFLSSEYPKLSS